MPVAASMRTRARRRAASASTSCSDRRACSARSAAARARSTSIWLATSATSESTVTRSWLTSTKPPCTAIVSSVPPSEWTRTVPMSSAPTKGAWPVRNAISPPPMVRAMTRSASPVQRIRSGETTSTWSVIGGSPASIDRGPGPLAGARSLGQLGCLGASGVGAADVEEGLLGQVVQVAVDQLLEAVHRLLHRGEDAVEAREVLGHEHRLRQEALDLAGP